MIACQMPTGIPYHDTIYHDHCPCTDKNIQPIITNFVSLHQQPRAEAKATKAQNWFYQSFEPGQGNLGFFVRPILGSAPVQGSFTYNGKNR